VGSTRPHLTYHLAESYDERQLDAALAEIAMESGPLFLATHGLGVFRGEQTVLYLHVTPDERLMSAHERIWSRVGPLAKGAHEIYAPATWVPHITLAAGPIEEAQLPVILQFLNRKPYEWRTPATNMCFVPDVTTLAREWIRYPMRAAR
jgi:2'-5' RNA ligase